jgi:hypothetical protein
MNTVTEEPERFSLRIICRSLLARRWLWPSDGRSDGFRQDIEELLDSIGAIDPSALPKYIWALLHLSSRMPELLVGRGDLAGLFATLPARQNNSGGTTTFAANQLAH